MGSAVFKWYHKNLIEAFDAVLCPPSGTLDKDYNNKQSNCDCKHQLTSVTEIWPDLAEDFSAVKDLD